MEKEAKEAFYNELYQLDDVDEVGEEQEEEILNNLLCRSRPIRSVCLDRPIHSSPTEDTPGRIVSTPLHQSPTSTSNQITSPAHVLPSPHVIMSTNIQIGKHKNAVAPKSTPAKERKKRKRGQSLLSMPEEQQIFKGLAFCVPIVLLPSLHLTESRQSSFRTMTSHPRVAFESRKLWSGERSGSGSGSQILLM